MPYVQPQVTNLPDNLYTRGAVVSTLPQYYNYIMLAKARREAKQQAVDSYYQDLSKDLTSAGMAGNDVNDFTGKVNDWRDYVIQNRQILSNPNHPEYANVARTAGYKYNDAQQLASISKDKVKGMADARPLIHPDNPLTDDATQMMNDATLPVLHGYKPMNFSKIAYNPKADPTTVKDWNDWREYGTKGLSMTPGNPQVITDPKTKSKSVVIKSSYAPEQLSEIATRYETLYNKDPKFMKEVDAAMQDESTAQKANARFKEIYGHDLDIQHPEEFAVALMMPQTEVTKEQEKNFSPTTVKVSVNGGNGTAVNNVYQRVKNSITNTQNQTGVGIMPLTDLDSDARELIINSLNAGRKVKLKPEKLRVLIANNGDLRVIKGDSPDLIGAFSPDEFNLRANSAKQDQQILNNQQNNNNTPSNNQGGYTNITETNKGKIGVKNGKWYDIKTGKPIE